MRFQSCELSKLLRINTSETLKEKKRAAEVLLWCVVPVSAACSPSSSHWLPVWCPVLCKLRLWKAAKVYVCPSTLGPCRCLVWDFCRPFNGSGHYNGHIVLRRVRQNTCQGWSRLITAPVKVGGPLVTQCRTLILSFIPCFFLEEKSF